jgi:hypothetical protein
MAVSARPEYAPRVMSGQVVLSLFFGLMMLVLTGGCWGLVGLWVASGACYADEHLLFLGLWLGSLVFGIFAIAFAWGGGAKFLAFLDLLILFGWIILWVELGHMAVSACPLAA